MDLIGVRSSQARDSLLEYRGWRSQPANPRISQTAAELIHLRQGWFEWLLEQGRKRGQSVARQNIPYELQFSRGPPCRSVTDQFDDRR